MTGNLFVDFNRYEYPAIETHSLEEILNELQEYEVVGIDEGQFFPDVLHFFIRLLLLVNLYVIKELMFSFRLSVEILKENLLII